MDESRIGQYSISVTTYPIMALVKLLHIGLGDVTPSESLKKMKGKLIQNGYDKCDEYIRQLKEGTLTSAAGQSEEETLEGIFSSLKFF